MAIMTIRTTVAFDPATAARLERLAKRWGISKSETLRRALETAEMQAAPLVGTPLPTADEIAAMTPREALAWLRSHPQQPPDFSGMTALQILDWLRQHPTPPVPGGWGDDPHRELREMREMDAEIEEVRERERRGSKVAETGDCYGS
jgi:predicted transcriptional regulator